jgi:predicted secreted protein
MADIVQGGYVRIYIDDVLLAKETEASVKLTLDGKTISHKDITGNWTKTLPGSLSMEISGSSMHAKAEGYDTIVTAMTADPGETVELIVGINDEDGFIWTGNFFFSSLEKSASAQDWGVYSFTAMSHGKCTRSQVPAPTPGP